MFNRILSGLILSGLFTGSSCAQAPSQSDSIKNIALFQIIRTGNTKELEKSLANGANSNGMLEGYSALMAAALNGSAEEMKILMAHGAHINFMNEDSVTALWLAVPDYDKTVLLLDAGADPQIRGKGGYTPIVKLATTYGSAPLMKIFIERGLDLKKAAPDNYLLYNAALSDDTAMLGICIRGGLNVNGTTMSGNYPIIGLLTNKSFNTLRMLVANGANVNAEDDEGLIKNTCTPLMLAALSNDRQSFFFLLDHGADANRKSSKGMTTLMYAMQAETDDPEITKALLDRGANPSDKMADGTDALYYAEKMGNTESVKLIRSRLKNNAL
jgi:ankyrin repeat protein